MITEGKKYLYDSITDFHTHILPCMDDGSQSTDESAEMLRSLVTQGVSSVVLTPHFYPHRESPADFLQRRERSVNELKTLFSELGDSNNNTYPKMYLGAEVAYFSGIRISPSIPRLCIEGTNLLLVEMPFERWSAPMINDLCAMKKELNITPVIAHIERYFGFFGKSLLDQLKNTDIPIQADAGALLHFSTRSKVLKLIRDGYVGIIGSDCHNMTARPPRMGEAFDVIGAKLGEKVCKALINKSIELLGDGKAII